MNLKDKISTARDRIKELELMVSVWESQLPKKKFGDKNDHVEPTITTPVSYTHLTLPTKRIV